ncbi:lysostaphin resistance A-like protein [Pseudoalteromonas xiamenensis]
MYLNFDKALVLFILAGLYPFLFDKQVSVSNETLGISPRSKLILILLFGSIFPLAMKLELIELEMGLPSWWWLFALNNLLITCTVEEAFFRGALQGQVLNRFGAVSALLISSVLFGAAHFAGGLEYVLVATIAGLGYGYVYASTGRLSLAVLSHFAVNFIHLAFFTYPKLAPIDSLVAICKCRSSLCDYSNRQCRRCSHNDAPLASLTCFCTPISQPSKTKHRKHILIIIQ